MLSHLLAKIETALGHVLGFLMFAMVADVTWQVLTRFVMSQPSSYTEEIARYLLMWIGLLGAAYAYRRHAHLGLDIVTRSMRGTNAAIAQKIADALCLFFAVTVMVIGGWNLVSLTWELNQLSAALEIKMAYIYSVLPISGMLIVIFALERILLPHVKVAEQDAMRQ